MGSACGRWATTSAGLTLKKVQGCMVALNGKHLLWRKNVVNCRGKYESLLNEWGLRMTDHLEDSSYDRPLAKISWLHYYHTLIDKMFPSHSEWIISLSMLLLLPYVHMSFECMSTWLYFVNLSKVSPARRRWQEFKWLIYSRIIIKYFVRCHALLAFPSSPHFWQGHHTTALQRVSRVSFWWLDSPGPTATCDSHS